MTKRTEPDVGLEDLIRNLTEIRDEGGVLAAYEFTPKLHRYLGGPNRSYTSVDFRAEIIVSMDWRPSLKGYA